MIPVNEVLSKEEVKRRKSAQINNFPSININLNNLNTSYKSTSDLSNAQPIFKSNSLFAYQEFDRFSSFCDDNSIQSELLSDKNKKNSLINNINNNNSTKLEECEQSENSDESFDCNDMSEDEIIFKKYQQRMEKRKSALHSVPSYFKNIPSINKPNNAIFSHSDKKTNKNEINNNINNESNIILNNNCPYNNRRNSQPINQFRNAFFNNIFFQNNNNFFQPNIIDNNNISNIGNNNYLNTNTINNNKQNITFNNSQNNYQNYIYPNYQHFNNYFNSNSSKNCIPNHKIINQNFNQKKRNSQIIINPNQVPQNAEHRRSSHIPLNSNFQIIIEKQFDKGKIKEENPNYFLRDQSYCRDLQKKLDKNINDKKYSEEFYNNIKPHLIEIIEHKFGNYVIQKFLNVLLVQENKIIFEDIFWEIKEKLFSICVHNFGTRVIQKTLEKLDNGVYSKIETEKLNSIFKSLIEKNLYELCCDKNGNHVYQKLLRVFPKENNKNNFLYDELIKISFDVSIIQQGATLLGAAFDYSNQNQKEKLSEAIVERISDLINDKYGNYTIQTVFKLFDEKINEKIFKYLDDNLLNLSKEKFSSNVIDKCLIKDYDKSYNLIESMFQKKIIKEMILDQFGNYIVQKAMSISDEKTCEKFAEEIKPVLGELQKTNIGKKIYEKLMQNYKDYLKYK